MVPASIRIAPPLAGERAEEVGRYVARVPGEDAWPVLTAQMGEVHRLLRALADERAQYRYAPTKWSVKEVVGHLADCERIYAYRALRIAREDATAMSGFDENRYVPAGRFDARPLGELLEAWRVVRLATLSLYRGLDDEALLRRGVANGHVVSVRAIAWSAAGHTLHHLGVLRERYGIG